MYEFEYLRAPSANDAVAAADEDSRYLAGGQSLVQSMRLRLASASKMIDLGGIEALRGIRKDGDNLVIGAMTTHAEVARSELVRQAQPALADLAAGIGDQMVRNMGTIGGSLANADPAACYPAGILGLGATVRTNRRKIAADDFFQDLFETALEPGELITEISFAPIEKAAYCKFKQAASRFALVGVMVSRHAGQVRVAVTGAKSCAYRDASLEALLAADFTTKALDNASVSTDGMNEDLHASAPYRAAVVVEMARRALAQAT